MKLETGAQGYIFPGGTTLWANQVRERNERANKQLIERLYEQSLAEIRQSILAANGQLIAA